MGKIILDFWIGFLGGNYGNGTLVQQIYFFHDNSTFDRQSRGGALALRGEQMRFNEYAAVKYTTHEMRRLTNDSPTQVDVIFLYDQFFSADHHGSIFTAIRKLFRN